MTYRVLFLCTGNSARSQMAEALLNVLGKGRFQAFSAGSTPTGDVQPLAARLIRELGYTAPLRSKNWDEFAASGAADLDFVITVCDKAAGEACPVWPGQPVLAHWGVPDPAKSPDDMSAFMDAWVTLRRRIELLLALPLEKLDAMAREEKLRAFGKA
jgi:arsenate reductase (thioredoxin)